MKVVVISGKARHGKDTLASYMEECLTKSYDKKVLIIHYGDLLKYICRSLFHWNGNKDDAGRTLLQYVGTDVIRKQDPDFWVRFVADILRFFPDKWDYVLIPDARFPNEIEGLSEFHPYYIRIERPGYNELTQEQQKHLSETALDGYGKAWARVNNNGSLEDLRSSAHILCEKLMGEETK